MTIRDTRRSMAPDPTPPITPVPEGGGAQVPPPTPVAVAAASTPPVPAAPVVAAPEQVVSKKDFDALTALVNKIADGLAPPAAKPVTPPSDALAATVATVRNMALETALDRAGVTVPGLRELIAKSAPDDAAQIAAHVTKYAALATPAPVAPVAPVPVAAASAPAHQGRSDMGAPGAPAAGDILADNPLKWTKDQAWALFRKDPRDLRRRVEAWAWKGSMTNPYAMRRG